MIDDVIRIGERTDAGPFVVVDEPDRDGPGSVHGPGTVPGAAPATVLLVPPFAMSADSMFAASCVLVRNGLRVLRLEPRNAPDGGNESLRGFRLSRLQEDIEAVLAEQSPSALVAVSLAGRAALRAIAGPGTGVRAAALITPVVDVAHTLGQVMGEDLFDRITWDRETRCLTVLGHHVDLEFVHDCRLHGLHDLAGTERDIAAGTAELALVAGTDDPWVEVRQVRDLVLAARSGVELVEIPAASHQLYRNPVLAMRFFVAAADHLTRVLTGSSTPAVAPPFAEIVAQLEAHRRIA